MTQHDEKSPRTPRGAVRRFLSRLRHPYLFVLTAAVLAVDVVVPDMVPFADEIVFGGLTILFGSLKERRRRSRDSSESDGSADDGGSERS